MACSFEWFQSSGARRSDTGRIPGDIRREAKRAHDEDQQAELLTQCAWHGRSAVREQRVAGRFRDVGPRIRNGVLHHADDHPR
ncbi:conserved hypothetical protein [Ricinus communis]|uniref:Uncharacterized protein n=1 Tax=Ricinus communis TaxID=3988 RepID=B9T9J7_RICCO|nr:conserved hypothetical protein [Ricinus communis]